MERWEAIFRLFSFHPNVARFKCDACGKLYKSENGVYRHIDNQHTRQINDLRDKAIIESL